MFEPPVVRLDSRGINKLELQRALQQVGVEAESSHMGGSIDGGYPKMLVYNGKSY